MIGGGAHAYSQQKYFDPRALIEVWQLCQDFADNQIIRMLTVDALNLQDDIKSF